MYGRRCDRLKIPVRMNVQATSVFTLCGGVSGGLWHALFFDDGDGRREAEDAPALLAPLLERAVNGCGAS